jgi:phage terminase large subunit-like protein
VNVAEQVAYYTKLIQDSPELANDDVVDILRRLNDLLERNPLQGFEPHSDPQRSFFEAKTKVVAAFAGNQFGKTTSLVVRALIECVRVECLPDVLKSYKRFGVDGPAHGWIVAPSNDKLYDSILPTFRKWAPVDELFEGSFDKALEKQHRVLRFANGSTIGFKTYEMDADKFGGATLHWVGYDEPPPREIRDECVTRVMRMGGYEMFAMTPLKVNTGWIRRDIYRNRESPEITVVKGSMRDNPLLTDEQVEYTLSQYQSDIWRRAREHGDFVDVGGLIYPDFEKCVTEPPEVRQVRGWDVVVGMDPGIRNAAFVWVAFDTDGRAFIFDELLLHDQTPKQYAEGIAAVNAKWGIKDPTYVIDPSARNRSMVNAESVEGELQRFGIYATHGQNAVEAGVQQIRGRLADQMLLCAKNCVFLRDEIDEYAAEDRENTDEAFKVIKRRDHLCDALRYACMFLPYWPAEQTVKAPLGRMPDQAWPPPIFGRDGPVPVTGAMT